MDEDFTPEDTDGGADGKEEKSISSDLIRGHINTIILRALYDGDKYGYEILDEIERKSHGQYSLKQPSLYSALKRLEKDGYITSYWGGSVGGGRRKYFSLTDEGKSISEQNQSEWEYSRTIIDSLISDRDFDFSNPAPAAVNMRVLKDTTSRVPNREGEEEPLDYEISFRDDEERAKLEREYEERNAALETEKAALQTERERFEEEMRAREDAIRTERETQEEFLRNVRQAQEEELRNERAVHEEELRAERAVHEEELRAERAAHEEEIRTEREKAAQQIAEHETQLQETISSRDAQFIEEKNRYEETIRRQQEQLAEERRNREAALAEQEERILREQEVLFRQREQQLLHQNYLNLVNQPPVEQRSVNEYNYYSSPVPEAKEAETTPSMSDDDYRTVVREILSNAVNNDDAPPPETRARSVDGIAFDDLEARAAQDGIRIVTSGTKAAPVQESPESLVHKGKALFLSAIVVFFFCVALGAIVIGVQRILGLPLFYPYFIWGVGLALLLVTGLAYANHFGERSLRRKGPVIINAVVIYALLVIVTLIIALAVNIDFADLSQLATFVIFPILFFLGVILFGVAYYLQVRPKPEK